MENNSTTSANRELKISRTFNAPIELVWEAWSNPNQLKIWWGPDGFTTTIHKMDLVANGEWLLTLHGPDGTNYPNKAQFIEVVPFEKIVYKHFNPNFLVTIIFEAAGQQTHIHWSSLFDSAKQLEAVIAVYKADEGLKQNVERLAAYLNQGTN